MPYRDFPVSSLLQDKIKCYWQVSRNFTPAEPIFEVLPDSYAELIFFYGTACFLGKGVDKKPLTSPFLIGLLQSPVYIQAEGELTVVAARLYPWAVSTLLGVHPGKDAIESPVISRERLSANFSDYIFPGNEEDIVKKLDAYFLSRIFETPAEKTIQQAGQSIIETEGAISLKQLGKKLFITTKTLQRLFQRHVGSSPKHLARAVRFERVRDEIWKNPNINLTQLAYELGFADQAHLAHEFRKFSKKTPGQFANESILAKQKQAG